MWYPGEVQRDGGRRKEKQKNTINTTWPARRRSVDVERNLQYASHDTDRVDLVFPDLDVSPLGALQ
jgi:hypothetical protein